MNKSICASTSNMYVLLFSDWFEHSYCSCCCKGSGLAAKLGCCLQTDISKCRDPAMNPKQPYEKKKRKILFFCTGKGLGPQSVSLSVGTTLQYMNNKLWPTVGGGTFFFFECIHFQYHKQLDLTGICFQALSWYNRGIQFHREHWPFQTSQNAKL